MGDLPAEFLNIDGNPAEHLIFRGIDRNVSREALDRRGGFLTITSGRYAGEIVVNVMSYQPGGDNSRAGLRAVVGRTLDEFGLTGDMV